MLQKVLTWGSLAIAVIAAFTDAIPMVAAILVVLGLIAGFMNPLEDVGTRVAYYVLAAALPGIATTWTQFQRWGDRSIASSITWPS